MIKKTKEIIAMLLIIGLATTSMVGCKGNQVITDVIQKTYDLVINAQKYVVEFDEQELYANITLLKTPIQAITSAIEFSLGFVDDEDLKANIDKFVKIANEVVYQIDSLDSANLSDFKATIVDVLVQAQGILQEIGGYLGAEIRLDAEKGIRSFVDIDNLIGMSDELNSLIEKHK